MKNLHQDDLVLIERHRRGDAGALNELIIKHQARAYQYALRLSRDTERASDVVAEAFVRVYKALGNFKGDSAFSTWLYRILTNCYLDMLKREKSRPSTSLEMTVPSEGSEITREYEDRGPTPHELAEQDERERTVAGAVERLPEYQKAMILMYHVEMLSYEEIAKAMQVPIGTVKSRLNRARLTLRDLLKHDKPLLGAAMPTRL